VMVRHERRVTFLEKSVEERLSFERGNLMVHIPTERRTFPDHNNLLQKCRFNAEIFCAKAPLVSVLRCTVRHAMHPESISSAVLLVRAGQTSMRVETKVRTPAYEYVKNEEIPLLGCPDEGFLVGFNPVYLLEALEAVDGDEVRISFNVDDHLVRDPCLIQGKDASRLSLLMPMWNVDERQFGSHIERAA
ncbi:MAG: hypothetical protein ACPLRM_03940, partial [Anaerolineae bacterium]